MILKNNFVNLMRFYGILLSFAFVLLDYGIL